MLVQFTVILLILCTTNLTFLSSRLAPKHCLFGPQVGPYVHCIRPPTGLSLETRTDIIIIIIIIIIKTLFTEGTGIYNNVSIKIKNIHACMYQPTEHSSSAVGPSYINIKKHTLIYIYLNNIMISR